MVPPSSPAGATLLRFPEERAFLVVAATFTSPVEAEVARGHLEAHGIRAQLKDQGIVGVAWHLSNAVGGVKVVVAEEDLEAARLLLQNAVEPHGDDGKTDSDRFAQRAWRAAVLGMLLPLVMHLYSLRLLILCVTQPDPLSKSGKRHALSALAFDVVMLAVALAWFRAGAR